METYTTFLRSARSFEEFAAAEKTTVETGLTWAEAREACSTYNASRTELEIENGTKLEFALE